MNFFRTTDTTDTTIWKPGFNVIKCSAQVNLDLDLDLEGGSLQFYQYVHLKKDEELKMNYWFHLWV